MGVIDNRGVPEEPVVSKKSEQFYEKKLIIKYIVETGKKPVTDEDLSEEDLLEFTLVNIKVQPPADMSMSETQEMQGCKKRKPPPNLTPADTIKTFTQISTIPALHNSSMPGILLYMDLQKNVDQTEKLVLTGGVDKKALIYNCKEASTDKSVRNWNNTKEGYKASITISINNAEVTENSDVKGGTGTNDSIVRIWDIKAQQNVTTIEGHTRKVKSLSFSKNVYYLATSSNNEKKELHDLSNLLLSMQKDINTYLTDQMKITGDDYKDVEEMEEEEEGDEKLN
nr:10774_t:CDS:2 [Entrophospora candida]